jgi:hypothetical protein
MKQFGLLLNFFIDEGQFVKCQRPILEWQLDVGRRRWWRRHHQSDKEETRVHKLSSGKSSSSVHSVETDACLQKYVVVGVMEPDYLLRRMLATFLESRFDATQ